MNSRLLLLGAIALGACATPGSGPDPISVPTVALRADDGASAADVAASLREARARVALVAAPQDLDWFRAVAVSADLTLSGPAEDDGLGMAFLAPEPLGDTTLTLPYDGGGLIIHDALYEMEEERLLDLLIFRVMEDTDIDRALRRFLEYVATDVNNAAAVVIAVAVPSGAVGDRVARMLGPAYYDAVRCETGQPGASGPGGIRLFFGPEARMYCDDAVAEVRPVGDRVRADLIMGRR